MRTCRSVTKGKSLSITNVRKAINQTLANGGGLIRGEGADTSNHVQYSPREVQELLLQKLREANMLRQLR